MAEINLTSGLLVDLPKAIHAGNMYVAIDDSAVYIDASDTYRVRISHFPKTAYSVPEYPTYEDDFKVLGTYASEGSQYEALHRVTLPSFIQTTSRKTMLESIFPEQVPVNITLHGGIIKDDGTIGGSSVSEFYTDEIALTPQQIYLVSLNNPNYQFRTFQYSTVGGTKILNTVSDWCFDDGFVGPINDSTSRIRIAFKQKAAPVNAENIGSASIVNNLTIRSNTIETDSSLSLGGKAADAKVTGQQVDLLKGQISTLQNKVNILSNLRFAPKATTLADTSTWDKRLIYIYMGANQTGTSGKHTGYWYYYNDSTHQWEEGSQYTKIIDAVGTENPGNFDPQHLYMYVEEEEGWVDTGLSQGDVNQFEELGLGVQEMADGSKVIVSNYFASADDPDIPPSRMLIVTSINQMTDTTKVYVYNGEYVAYAANDTSVDTKFRGIEFNPTHWYYYNGSKWQDSGQTARVSLDPVNRNVQIQDPVFLDKTGQQLLEALGDISNLQEQMNQFATMLLAPAEYIASLDGRVIFTTGEQLVIGEPSTDQIGQLDISYDTTRQALVMDRNN